MAKRPPVQSIVVKTPKPTPAQIAQQRRAAAAQQAADRARANKPNLISGTNASYRASLGPPGNRQTGSRNPRYIPPQRAVQSPLNKAGLAVTGGKFPGPVRPKPAPKAKPAVIPVKPSQVKAAPSAQPGGARPTVNPTAPAAKVPKTFSTPKQPATPRVLGGQQPVTSGGGMAGLFGGIGPNAYVNNLYAPMEQMLQNQQDARIAAFQSLVKDFAASLATQGQSLQPFLSAGSQIAADANNSATSMIGQNPNGQVQSDLQAIGAPASQQANVASQLGNVFGGGAGVLNYVGGALPADQFAQDMAARASYLQGLPVIGQQLATRGLNQLSYQGEQAALQLAQQKAAALEKARTDLATYVQNNQKQKLANQIAQQELGLKINNQSFNQAATKARLNQNAVRIKLGQANADRNYQLSLSRLGVQKASLRLRALQADRKLKQGKYSPSFLFKLKNLAAGSAHDAFNGVTDKNGNIVQGPISYQQAFRDQLQHDIPPSVAQAALNYYWLPSAKGASMAKVNGQTYVYFPGHGERPIDGRPIGVPSLAKPKRKRR